MRTRRIHRAHVLAIATVIVTSGCAAHAKHLAVVADTAIYEALSDVHIAEQRALCGLPSCAGSRAVEVAPGWTAAKSRAFNATLLPAVEAGRQYNALIATWRPGTPVPAQVHDLIAALGAALTAITRDFPDGTTKAGILSRIGTVQALALQTLDLALTLKEGGR